MLFRLQIVSALAVPVLFSTQFFHQRLFAAPPELSEPAQIANEAELVDQTVVELAGRLRIQRLELVELALPMKEVVNFRARLILDGAPVTLDLGRHSLRSSDFRVRIDEGGGQFREVPAPAVSTYRGRVVERPGSLVAGSLVDGELRAVIWLGDGSKSCVTPRRSVDPGAPRAQHLVYDASEILPPAGAMCGTPDRAAHPFQPAPDPPQPPAATGGENGTEQLFLAEIAFDTDVDFYEDHGNSYVNVVQNIESVMSVVDAIYRTDVAITYEITEIIVRASEPDPYESSYDSYALMDEFRSHWNAEHTDIRRDIAHLVTGRPPTHVAGLGASAAVCDNTRGYALSHRKSELTVFAQLVAHELGHNWSADHCYEPDCTIMCTPIGCSSGDSFGSSSRASIINFRDQADCLDLLDRPTLPCDQSRLLASDGIVHARFGTSVAIDGDVAAVGTEAEGDDYPASGSVYVERLVEGAWVEQAKVRGLDTWWLDGFGTSIDLSGDVLLVGAPRGLNGVNGDFYSTGAAYFFRFDGSAWVQETKLTPDSHYLDRFGWSVAFDGDRAIVGAPDMWNFELGTSGAAFAFTRDAMGWMQTQMLVPGDANGNKFGTAVGISGESCIIGTPYGGPNDQGAVYLYRFTGGTWVEDGSLQPAFDDPRPYDGGFGWAVAIEGDVAVVGAPAASTAYILRRGASGWDQEAVLLPVDAADIAFGYSVATDAARVIVGGRNSSYIYEFDGNAWVGPRVHASITGLQAFGHAVAIAADAALIGAPSDSSLAPAAGAAYVIDLSNPSGVDCAVTGLPYGCDPMIDCNGNGIHDECDISQGDSGDCDGNGVPDECEVMTDCNANGFADECDISSGTSADCDTNGIPDECEVMTDCNANGLADRCDLSSGTISDCNENAIPDECDIADLTSDDCNENGTPDECEVGTHVAATSPRFTPLGANVVHTWMLEAPREATDDVTFRVTASGDLFGLFKYVYVDLNGITVGAVFNEVDDIGVIACEPATDEFSLSSAGFNAFLAGGDATFTLHASDPVDPAACSDSFVELFVTYSRPPIDLDGNGIPDECECPADFTGDGDVGFADLTQLLSAWGRCSTPCPEDLTDDADVGFADLTWLLGAWGPC